MLNSSVDYKLKVYAPVREFKARVTFEIEKQEKSYFPPFRYIRDWINGNSANTTNYWNAIKVFNGSTDLAQGKMPTTNGAFTNPTRITDGDDTTYGYAWAGNIYAQIDLGSIRNDIDKIQVIHYYLDGRTFYGSKIEVSEDGLVWQTLRDSAIDGTYKESATGIILLPDSKFIKTYDDDTIIRMNILEEMSTLNDSLPSNELQLTMDNSNGDFDMLSYSNMHKIIASKPTLKTELGLVINENTVEWIPTGMFFLSEWRNEVTNKIITLVGNDYFNLFNEISYEPTGITNLKDLAIDVLTKGGVPVENQQVDNSLANITIKHFPERLDIRTALQHIAIAAGATVNQDRLGNVFIKHFKTIDEATNYLSYTVSQPSLFGYAGPGTFMVNDTGGGMKYLDFDAMYEAPQVSLEKSIYQLVIKIYNANDTAYTEKLYTNDFIQGTSGQSFTIDNPLIHTEAIADKVAEWYIREINYNAFYSVNWRQNPILECADMILVEDSFNAEKQTRIVRQEINYQGYLEGFTESRGGI